ncbi:Uncharacterised protein [Vibrio cholerae]|uniref:Uncharacterized protein n=1 Tax=Vibrio cholerae TaxID=666 RepID=A0A655PE41_VIBCL|nr:Uncharacterised protein [Vibrio cholerae]CSA38854.1 Uncharacterised protein [Vibrio cholerae]CSA54607.1 Uncharacterised protein [Vibrio cholerae]CSC66864.1 Uncharacterised protein [Vibrio cholerae]
MLRVTEHFKKARKTLARSKAKQQIAASGLYHQGIVKTLWRIMRVDAVTEIVIWTSSNFLDMA